MNNVDRFQAYADAFEESYADDNWQRLEVFFTEDAEYDGAVGREALLDKLRASVNDLDRRMDSRTLSFQPPQVHDDQVIVDWTVRYSRAGCPDLVINGRETATFEGDRIRVLHDDIDAGSRAAFGEWMEEFGAQLGAVEDGAVG